jgi:hypothetical protein
VDYLPRLILYEQGGIPRIIAVLPQFSHDPMPMFRCGLMVLKVHTVLIVMRVVRGADHKMVTRHIPPPGFHDRTSARAAQFHHAPLRVLLPNVLRRKCNQHDSQDYECAELHPKIVGKAAFVCDLRVHDRDHLLPGLAVE